MKSQAQKSRRQKRRDMPSQKKIYDYWVQFLIESGLMPIEVFDEDREKFCFACGKIGYVERAHIEAFIETENNDVSNLHLLCPNCHKESEGYKGEMYFLWLKSFDKHQEHKIRIERRMRFVKSIASIIENKRISFPKFGNTEDFFERVEKIING